MSIAAHIVGTRLVALRQIVAAVILSAFDWVPVGLVLYSWLGKNITTQSRNLSAMW